jgi:hypothetical protein
LTRAFRIAWLDGEQHEGNNHQCDDDLAPSVALSAEKGEQSIDLDGGLPPTTYGRSGEGCYQRAGGISQIGLIRIQDRLPGRPWP